MDAGRLLADYFGSVLNGRDVAAMQRLFAKDVVYHPAGGKDIRGLADLEAWVQEFLDGVPNYEATLEDIVATPTMAVLRWSCTGTHGGTMVGVPATGRRFRYSGMTMVRVDGGRIVEGWVERDSLGLHRQLTV